MSLSKVDSPVSDQPPDGEQHPKSEVKQPERCDAEDLGYTAAKVNLQGPTQAIFAGLLAQAPSAFDVASPEACHMVRQLRSLSETLWCSSSIDTWTEFWNAVIGHIGQTSHQTGNRRLEHWWIWLHEQLRHDVVNLELSYDGSSTHASPRQQPCARWRAVSAVDQLIRWSEARVFVVWQAKLSNQVETLARAIVNPDSWSRDQVQAGARQPQPTMDDLVGFLDQVCVTCEQCCFTPCRRLRIFWVVYRQMAMVAVGGLFQTRLGDTDVMQVESNWCRLNAWWQRYVTVMLSGGYQIVSPLILLEDSLRVCRYMQQASLQDRVLRHQVLCASLRRFEEQWLLPIHSKHKTDNDVTPAVGSGQVPHKQMA